MRLSLLHVIDNLPAAQAYGEAVIQLETEVKPRILIEKLPSVLLTSHSSGSTTDLYNSGFLVISCAMILVLQSMLTV